MTSWLDRAIAVVSPKLAFQRARYSSALAILDQHVARPGGRRHYEAASKGRRTEGWPRMMTDANLAAGGALSTLRAHARDLVRNNGWAQSGLSKGSNNVVGWGIMPKALSDKKLVRKNAKRIWNAWADSTACDYDGRLTLYGMQRLVQRMTMEAGECIVRRHRVAPGDPLLPVPIKLQILEPDFIDTSRDGLNGENGNRLIQGVEFDNAGKRVAYWLFKNHPGAALQITTSRLTFQSVRVDAADILHIYRLDRAGQVRGVTAFAPAIVKLKDFDEFEDAQLLRQKIAACFAAFTTDPDGENSPMTEVKQGENGQPDAEQLEPGLITNLPGGRSIEFANPPSVANDGFSKRTLQCVAAGIGVTYEQLTGDYSNVNFSSARMARIEYMNAVHQWRWDVVIPQFCMPVWAWVMEQAFIAGMVREIPRSAWTPPPLAMIEPDKEGLAIMRMVRAGLKTPDEAVRELGEDPDEFWDEYAANFERLDALGIVIDSDARKVSQAGLTQARPPGSTNPDPGAPGETPTPPGDDAGGGTDNGKAQQSLPLVFTEQWKPTRTAINLRRGPGGVITGTIDDSEFHLTRNEVTGELVGTLKEK